MTCEICNKKIVWDEDTPRHADNLGNLFFEFHRQIAGLHYFQKISPQLSTKYPTQCEKLKPIISKLETLVKEQMEPNIKKIDQVLKDFFNKKGKVIPKFHGSHDEWISPCEDCEQELEKQVKLAVDDIEKARMGEKFKEVNKQGEEIARQIPESEFDDDKSSRFTIDYLNEQIDRMNKEIITERERQNWERYQRHQLHSMNHH